MTEKQNGAGSDLIVRARTATPAVVRELEDALLSGKAPVEVQRDPEDVQREIIAALLYAESDEELERVEAKGWGNYVGVPFEVLDFVWRPSTYEDGSPVFLVVRALRMDDGSPHVLTTGSAQVMAILANLAKRDRLPAIRELRAADTKAGNKVYWLATPESVAQARREEAAAAATGGDA